MPSPLKRPSLARLLASLRPSRAGEQPSSFPVRTGFPTSLADIVLKNHGRLTKPRKTRRAAPLAPPPSTSQDVTVDELSSLTTPPPTPQPPSTCPAVTVDELSSLTTPPPPTPQPLSPVAAHRLDTPRVFRLRPDLLALGGAAALALLAVWSEGTVATFTVAALSLLWIESASRRRPTETTSPLDSCGRGPASPIREAEEAPRSSSSDSDEGSEASTPRTTEGREPAGAAGDDDSSASKRKGKRSLRKLISKKLQKKLKSRDSSRSLHGDDADHPEAIGGDADPVLKTESSVAGSESSTEWSSSSSSESVAVMVVDQQGPSVKFPLSAFVPVILTGLAAGKLPATALAVLCVAFSGAVQRLYLVF